MGSVVHPAEGIIVNKEGDDLGSKENPLDSPAENKDMDQL